MEKIFHDDLKMPTADRREMEDEKNKVNLLMVLVRRLKTEKNECGCERRSLGWLVVAPKPGSRALTPRA